MLIHFYNPQNSQYVSSIEWPDNQAMPAYSTKVNLEQYQANETLVFNGESWEIVANFKGKYVFEKATGSKILWNEIGFLPDEYTEIPCPDKNLYSWSNNQWIQDIEKYKYRDRKFRENELNGLQWIYFRHEQEQRLVTIGHLEHTSITDENILELDKYYNAWRNFMNETWFLGKQYPTRPAFLE